MTDRVMVRDVAIGGGSPISIQSMTNVDSRDEKALLRQIRELEDAGCEIIRISVPDMQALDTFREVRKKTGSPLVADIHFDHRLAVGAIEAGADKVRINPGNIGSEERVRAVVDAAKARHIPIRVGVNSGSLEKDILEKYGKVTAEGLAESALRNVRLLEDMDFGDIVISIKSSNVRMTYDAYRIAAEKTSHPFHVGITEAGTLKRGQVKSAAGIGALLLSGIGDTIRVSLTSDPVNEVYFAKSILEAVGEREPKFDIVSCPTCGRTRIDLEPLVNEVEKKLEAEEGLPGGLRIAVMGCVVNGPGEAREADFGVCGGDKEGLIIRKGEILKKVPEEDLAEELMTVIRETLR
ncbi:MAG: flavodoxin-dependent (E)-4-hydroxy-3-methylbut-2-enyl-diphosphate synthase [Eubacterium sp.]|nr:flavodoxin-dependent (E)-4-hydroxy-3-methylbut-2-enyl-diphosphate synthase [Eubacterium sp.]